MSRPWSRRNASSPYRHPSRFAALLVVCGRVQTTRNREPIVPVADGDPFDALAARLRNVPLQIFHGDADAQVPVEESRRAIAALRKAGSTAIYTELPGVGHNAWDTAYRSADVVEWLLSQRIKYQEGHRYLIDADLSSATPQSPHLVNAVYTVRRVVSRVSVPPRLSC